MKGRFHLKKKQGTWAPYTFYFQDIPSQRRVAKFRRIERGFPGSQQSSQLIQLGALTPPKFDTWREIFGWILPCPTRSALWIRSRNGSIPPQPQAPRDARSDPIFDVGADLLSAPPACPTESSTAICGSWGSSRSRGNNQHRQRYSFRTRYPGHRCSCVDRT